MTTYTTKLAALRASLARLNPRDNATAAALLKWAGTYGLSKGQLALVETLIDRAYPVGRRAVPRPV